MSELIVASGRPTPHALSMRPAISPPLICPSPRLLVPTNKLPNAASPPTGCSLIRIACVISTLQSTPLLKASPMSLTTQAPVGAVLLCVAKLWTRRFFFLDGAWNCSGAHCSFIGPLEVWTSPRLEFRPSRRYHRARIFIRLI